ncbi:hypothetical protein [Paenibacillus sp. L3-i20]|uniref:hypothetical protein n=1 Tax=Paenibacillus sp. L3-i20 TaxID=2905833 RepID=UPI001EDE02D3|nr:hypothetical protein [Paenibacillus sp. L3-i20]GKU76861.1 hypothetical protein L3i20_v212580 [Paenibacillus sp. L3-i20]
MTIAYSIFKVNEDYILAETENQAVRFHLESQGILATSEEIDVAVVPFDRSGRFERMDGHGYDEVTFGELLKGFVYTVPQLLCWND